MSVWAIADFHLSFGVPDKKMGVFGPNWEDHEEKIATHWREKIKPEDLILIAGDISWAMRLEEAIPDLQWIDALPGTKLLLKGNHDHWWTSLGKITKALPPSVHAIQNNAFLWNNIGVGGARLWDSEEYNFDSVVDFKPNPKAKPKDREKEALDAKKLFERELQRLELSLNALDALQATHRLAMTHYPPIGLNLAPSRASALLEAHKVEICVFGHLHNVCKQGLFGQKNGVSYYLTSCDYLDFNPIQLL